MPEYRRACKTKNIMKYILYFVLIIFLVSGCTYKAVPDSTSSPEPTLAIPLKPEMSTEKIVASPVTTITSTQLLTSTFSPGEKQILLSRLLTDDYLCDLPCWGGIEPGVTTISDATNFLKTIATTYSPGHSSVEIKYQGTTYIIGLFAPNDTVDFLLVPRLQYSMTQLLQKYGRPDGVYLYILDVLPIDTNNPYSIFLFYKDQGIIAEYNGESPKGEILSLCLTDTMSDIDPSIALFLWKNGANLEFRDVLSQYGDQFYDFSSLEYYSLTELSDYSINDFYETFSDFEKNNNCLHINNPNDPT